MLYDNVRKHLGDVFKELASHRESQIHEGHLMGDHIHMLISIPPKYSVSQIVGHQPEYALLGISKAKSLFTSLGHIWESDAISRAKVFGLEVTMQRQLVEMRRRCGNTSATGRLSIVGLTNWTCSVVSHL